MFYKQEGEGSTLSTHKKPEVCKDLRIWRILPLRTTCMGSLVKVMSGGTGRIGFFMLVYHIIEEAPIHYDVSCILCVQAWRN